MDFLKSAVASAISKGPPFPYTFGDQIDVDNSIWKLYNGTKRVPMSTYALDFQYANNSQEDGSNCSIFSFDINANKSRLPLAKNALRKLRTLRHPGIIKVLEAVETDTYIYIATERLVPLSWHVRRQALSVETTKWGLFTVASTLRFVNDEGASVHGNIRISSIFTSESGEWKLGGLDILSSMKEEDAVIYTYAGLVPDVNRNVAPEISKTGWDTIKRNPLPAVDSYSFGILIYEVFNGGNHGSDQPGQTRNIPPSMQQSYKRLLNANPKARLSVSHFLEQGRRSGGFFETPLIRLSEGVESLGLKNDAERAELLSELDELSEDFPEEFFKMKILPELLKSMEFGGGGPKVFGLIIKIGEKLSDDDFETRLNPVILRLFASPDRQIRVCLLDNLPKLIDHFSQKVVTDKIFPQIVSRIVFGLIRKN
jgi:SCY1-like protein 1